MTIIKIITITITIIKINKNNELDLKDRIENYKNFDKRAKENNRKLKENGPNSNHYYH